MKARYGKNAKKRVVPESMKRAGIHPASTAGMFDQVSDEPIEYSPEYQELVNDVLQAKARREQRDKTANT